MQCSADTVVWSILQLSVGSCSRTLLSKSNVCLSQAVNTKTQNCPFSKEPDHKTARVQAPVSASICPALVSLCKTLNSSQLWGAPAQLSQHERLGRVFRSEINYLRAGWFAGYCIAQTVQTVCCLWRMP